MKFPTAKPSFLKEKATASIRLRIEPGRLAAWRNHCPGKSLSDAIKQATDLALLPHGAGGKLGQ